MSDTVQLNVDGNDTGDSVTFMTHEISGTDRPEENEEFMQILQCHCVISSTSGQHKLLMIIIYRMQRWLRLLCITITDGAAGDECLCLQSAITLVNYKFVESCNKE